MTNFTSPLVETRWESEVECGSTSFPGVHFLIARMSFGRRADLAKRIQGLAQRVEFLDAGGSVRERLESAVLTNEIDRIYAEWALLGISGLLIDGEPATPTSLIERGPVDLAAEAVSLIKRECGLSDTERKN